MALIRFLGERHAVRVVAYAGPAQAPHAGELAPYVAELCLVQPAVTLRAKWVNVRRALQRGDWRRLGQRAVLETREAIAGWAAAGQADVLLCVWTEMGHYLATAPPGVVGLGQVVLAPGQRTLWECYLTERYSEHFAKLARPGYALTFWDCLSGSLSLPADLLARSGGFDPTFMRHEDVEFGYRLDRLGANFVYAPQAVGEHCFTRSVEAGLRDALREGHSAAHLTLRHPALCDRLLQARWRRYSPAGRTVMSWALAEAGRHARMAAAARIVQRVEASALPAAMRRPAYQLACHLQFWLGVRGVEEGLVPLLPRGH